MTVQDVARKAGPYQYQAGVNYPFSFRVFNKSDLLVIVADVEEVETALVLDDDYTVELSDDQENAPGGVIFLKKELEDESTVTILSNVPFDQETVIANKSGFYPAQLNTSFDKLTILTQQLKEEIDRSLKVRASSIQTPDEFRNDLEQRVTDAATAASQSADSAKKSEQEALKAAQDAATALSQSNTALEQSGLSLEQSETALEQSTTAVETSANAEAIAEEAKQTIDQANANASEALNTANSALYETSLIDQKVDSAVKDAISGVEIPGLNSETISAALGYVPYDGETNNKSFATTEQLSDVADELYNAVEVVESSLNGAVVQTKTELQSQITTNASGVETNASEIEQLKALIQKVQNSSGRNVFEYFFASMPVDDAGAHLADGTKLMSGGVYDAFINKVKEKYNANPSASYFTTEEEWQASVSTYGACGKYVVGSDYVRLPKVSDIIQGTTDISQCGALIEAGLPNITGSLTLYDWSKNYTSEERESGALAEEVFEKGRVVAASGGTTVQADNTHVGFNFDASRSSPVYRNDIQTVQPQTIQGLLYIVVGTSTKTDVQVNIDNVLTDLNNKADRDLSNTAPAISFAEAMDTAGIRTVVETWRSDTEWYRKWSDGWIEQGGEFPASTNYTVTLSTPFKTTTYTISGAISYLSAAEGWRYSDKTTTTFVVNRIGNVNCGGSWIACGY